MSKERRLGRGLEALLGQLPGWTEQGPPGAAPAASPEAAAAPVVAPAAVAEEPKAAATAPVDRIDVNPHQPRQDFDPDELGRLALKSRNPATLSSICTVFAESEVVGLIAAGHSRKDIAAGLGVLNAFVTAGLATSNGEVRRAISNNAVAVNDTRITSDKHVIGEIVRMAAAQFGGAPAGHVGRTAQVARRLYHR